MFRTTLTSLATLALGLVPMIAGATSPSPNQSILPRGILVVGTQGGVLDEGGRFEVLVRDAAGVPVPNAEVVLDFSGCARTHLCDGAGDPVPTSCSPKLVRKFADANGRASFIVVGASPDEGTPPDGVPGPNDPGPGCVRIFANGVELGRCKAAVFDLNGVRFAGVNGCEVVDQHQWLHAFGIGVYYERYDYDFNGGALNVTDFSFWVKKFGDGTSYSGCMGPGGAPASFCP